MRKMIAFIIAFLFINQAIADNAAQLKINIATPSKQNNYFLCLTTLSCASINAGDKGKTFPMDPGSIDRIFIVNVRNYRVYMQTLPASCHISPKANQTLIVSGHIKPSANDNIIVDNLQCKIAS